LFRRKKVMAMEGSLRKHLEEIKETQRQVSKTSSQKRKADLRRHLRKQWAEYREAQRYLREAR